MAASTAGSTLPYRNQPKKLLGLAGCGAAPHKRREKGGAGSPRKKKRKDKKGEWANAKSIGNAINTKRNEGMAKLSTCGRWVYFSACAWENVKGGCDVYMAEYDVKNDVIDKLEPVNGLNSEFWDSQPSISCDGTTMYFVSNREGGLGGTDIWKSKLEMANGEPHSS